MDGITDTITDVQISVISSALPRVAELTFKFYMALLERGFEQEDAMRIVLNYPFNLGCWSP